MNVSKMIKLLFVFCLYCVPCFGESMIEISVEVTEINNQKARELGIKWVDTINTGEIAGAQDGKLLPVFTEVPSIFETGEWGRYTPLTAELKILQEKGAAQILSKPKIVTKSGTSAKVIVGGEIPIVSSGVGGGSIQWKEFGIKTEILPNILADSYIDLILSTEVSRLDWSNQVSGNPAIMKREANSNIRIKSGQTIAIAGLIETKKEEKTSGIPLLCDIPILGHLFSRKSLVDTKTNVLIFVTPKILN